jgi:hypothetical protein
MFFEKSYKFHNVKVLSQDPVNKNNSRSLILTYLDLNYVCPTWFRSEAQKIKIKGDNI